MNERYRVSGLEVDGFGDGDIAFFVVENDNGRAYITRLAIPADWETVEAAGTPYVLGIVASRPAWRRGTGTVIATGWGNNWGNDWGNGA